MGEIVGQEPEALTTLGDALASLVAATGENRETVAGVLRLGLAVGWRGLLVTGGAPGWADAVAGLSEEQWRDERSVRRFEESLILVCRDLARRLRALARDDPRTLEATPALVAAGVLAALARRLVSHRRAALDTNPSDEPLGGGVSVGSREKEIA